MISIYNEETTKAALALPLDPELERLLAARIAHNTNAGLTDLTHLVVIQPGDTKGVIFRELGFSPLVNVTDGRRFGSTGFHPYWDWLQRHEGWFELIVTVGNDGFGFILLIEDTDGVLPDLLALCQAYS